MKLGIIYKDENYWSLQELNKYILKFISEKYEIYSYQYKKDFTGNSFEINELYKKSDLVLNLSSKSIDYSRKIYKPTIYMAHAWLCHGAGINLYNNSKYFGDHDCITFANKSDLKKYKYIYKKGLKAHYLPYFTEVNIPYISDLQKQNIFKKYNISQNKKIIIYFGRIDSEKNIETLISVFNSVKYKDTQLLIIGSFSYINTYGFGDSQLLPQNYKKKILGLINNSNRKDIILIESIKRNDLLKILSFSDIVLNFSLCYEEDFGISIIESMKFGIPVICSKWGGFKDIMIHGKTGFSIDVYLDDTIIPKLDIIQAVEYLNILLEDEKLYKNFSVNQKKRYKAYYSWKAFLKNIEKIININYKKWLKDTYFKGDPFVPLPYIKKIYDEAMLKNSVSKIYIENKDLYDKLYSFYI